MNELVQAQYRHSSLGRWLHSRELGSVIPGMLSIPLGTVVTGGAPLSDIWCVALKQMCNDARGGFFSQGGYGLLYCTFLLGVVAIIVVAWLQSDVVDWEWMCCIGDLTVQLSTVRNLDMTSG